MMNTTPAGVPPGAMTADFGSLLERGATLTLILAGTWLAAVALAGAVETLSAGRVRGLASVGCPQTWRPVVLALVGAALILPAGAAHAATAREEGSADGRWLPLPTRPVGLPTPTVRPQVAVRPGDTLWGIAGEQLSPAADDGTVMTYVARLHGANHDLIGDDPDLIRPGQRLSLPAVPREGARR